MGDNLIKTSRVKAEHNRRNRMTKKNRQKSQNRVFEEEIWLWFTNTSTHTQPHYCVNSEDHGDFPRTPTRLIK